MAIDQSIEKRFHQLRIWNIAVGLILAVQAVMFGLLTNRFSLPVTATLMTDAPGGVQPELHHLFNPRTGWGVFVLLAISAVSPLMIVSSPVFP
jgi:hypothetical protein